MANKIEIKEKVKNFKKIITVGSDKSISIRCVLLASQAIGKSRIYNLLESEDVFDALKAIKKINPNAEVTVNGNDVDNIIWHNGTEVISKSDIQAKQTELQTEYNNNKYQRDRAIAYPSIVDQLDDLYHNGIDGWKSTIKAIKDKYPKG